jgi:hypothetical protein
MVVRLDKDQDKGRCNLLRPPPPPRGRARGALGLVVRERVVLEDKGDKDRNNNRYRCKCLIRWHINNNSYSRYYIDKLWLKRLLLVDELALLGVVLMVSAFKEVNLVVDKPYEGAR